MADRIGQPVVKSLAARISRHVAAKAWGAGGQVVRFEQLRAAAAAQREAPAASG